MGRLLVKYYDLAKAEGGLVTQMRLAMQTNLSAQKAADAPDSAENLQKFREAFKAVTGKDALIS